MTADTFAPDAGQAGELTMNPEPPRELVDRYVAAKSAIVRLEAELENAQGLLEEWQERADRAERVAQAALRNQRLDRAHIALCRQMDVGEQSDEMIAIEFEMVAAAVDLDMALDDYADSTAIRTE